MNIYLISQGKKGCVLRTAQDISLDQESCRKGGGMFCGCACNKKYSTVLRVPRTENCLPSTISLIREQLWCNVCHGRLFSLYSPPSASSPNQKAPMSSGLFCPTESRFVAPDHIANGPRSAVLRCAGNAPNQGSEETTAVFRGIQQLLRVKQLTVH